MKPSIIGLDIAKHVFHLYTIQADGYLFPNHDLKNYLPVNSIKNGDHKNYSGLSSSVLQVLFIQGKPDNTSISISL